MIKTLRSLDWRCYLGCIGFCTPHPPTPHPNILFFFMLCSTRIIKAYFCRGLSLGIVVGRWGTMEAWNRIKMGSLKAEPEELGQQGSSEIARSEKSSDWASNFLFVSSFQTFRIFKLMTDRDWWHAMFGDLVSTSQTCKCLRLTHTLQVYCKWYE